MLGLVTVRCLKVRDHLDEKRSNTVIGGSAQGGRRKKKGKAAIIIIGEVKKVKRRHERHIEKGEIPVFNT